MNERVYFAMGIVSIFASGMCHSIVFDAIRMGHVLGIITFGIIMVGSMIVGTSIFRDIIYRRQKTKKNKKTKKR